MLVWMVNLISDAELRGHNMLEQMTAFVFFYHCKGIVTVTKEGGA